MSKSMYESLRKGWAISQTTQAEYMDTTRSQLNMFERAERPMRGKQELRALDLHQALQWEVPLDELPGVPQAKGEHRETLVRAAEEELAVLPAKLARLEAKLADSQKRYQTNLRKRAAAQHLLAGHGKQALHQVEKAWLNLRLAEAEAQLKIHNPLTHAGMEMRIKQWQLEIEAWKRLVKEHSAE